MTQYNQRVGILLLLSHLYVFSKEFESVANDARIWRQLEFIIIVAAMVEAKGQSGMLLDLCSDYC